jgi:asparagine synthase (glutamine-hydrolysing)
MCGIAGMVSLTGRPLERPELVESMMKRLLHRGPDEGGVFMNPSRTVSLGHRRLRIIDLVSGRQPLANEDGSVHITFNGEIYGFQALQESLRARGHQFRTSTDTEVIVHMYEDDGQACLDKLKGMFAFALWDERTETLMLARDRMGKKPLYYTTHHGQLFFASELHALLAVPDLSHEMDDLALDQYLTLGYIPAPRTIYRHIMKLEAGHYLLVKSGHLHKFRYWGPQCVTRESLDWEEARQELLDRLRRATALRMVSDVPLGCFLSGGIDSSTVLSFMAELSSQPVKTFSIGFPEMEYSELSFARTVARHFGTDHHEFVVEPDGVGVLDDLVTHFGEPFADSSALPTWYLSQLTRKSVTVALTGDGGDELFCGYNWYRFSRMLDAVSFVPGNLARMISCLPTKSGPQIIRSLSKGAAMLTLSPGEQYAGQRQMVTTRLKETLYTPEFRTLTGRRALDFLADQYARITADDPLNRAMAADLSTYMAEDLLVKVDRTSMAHALECRSPFLDVDFVEWVLGLPSSYKLKMNRWKWPVRNGGKWILREAVRDRLPPGLLDRPKQGFSVPLEYWFRGELREVVADRVLNGPLGGLGWLSLPGIQRVVEDHFTGRANNAAAVWALLVLATWVDRFSS